MNKDSMLHEIGLYPIVNSTNWIIRFSRYINIIQLRIKSSCKIENPIIKAIHLGHKTNMKVFINDYWQLAIRYQAYGVHLGQEDMYNADINAIHSAGLKLGISAYTDSDVDRALKVNPTYISLGPVFKTTSKNLSTNLGLRRLRQHVSRLSGIVPVVAIGGISLNNIHEVLSTGVNGVSVISAVTKKDWQNTCEHIQKLFLNYKP